MKTAWQALPKPFLVLAPMENVTDTVFRQIIAGCGKPDVFFTEFTNTDGMLSKGKDKVIQRLKFTDSEQPVIAQIWGTKPEAFFEATKIIVSMGFAGIDINMGCPDRSITSRGSCAALIKNPKLAAEIIQTTKDAAGDLPVSVKTRIGYNTIQTEAWIGYLLDQNIAALTVHGRTKKEMSKVPAHWEEIQKAVLLRDQMQKETLVIGNGDVTSYTDALQKHETYGVDGVMIGRGVFHNPWIFDKKINPAQKTTQERLHLLIQHITLFDTTWGKEKNFDIMKKFYKVYVSGFDGASNLREELVQLKNAKETITFLEKLLATYST